jgi:hemolysin activation/secretion protein
MLYVLPIHGFGGIEVRRTSSSVRNAEPAVQARVQHGAKRPINDSILAGISVGLALGLAVSARAQTEAQAPASAVAPNADAHVVVREFKVTGNSLLPQDNIDAVLATFKGDRTLADLRQAAIAVQQLYVRAGYGGIVAYLPEQALSGGVVTIAVVEGRLARVTVTGNQQFDAANVRAALPTLVSGATPRLKRIDTEVQISNENPAKKVEVLLLPGESAGQIDAKVTVHERPVTRWILGLDNSGNSRTGYLRASVGWQHANLWNQDHVLSTVLQTSPDKPSSVLVLSAGYRVPLYAQRAVIDAYAAYSDIDGNTATVAGDLRFNGRGHLAGLRATHYLPRFGEIDQRVSAALDHRAYLNQCGIAGLPAGACGAGGESVAVQPISIEYAAQTGGSRPIGATISLHHNLQLGDGRSSDDRFQAVRPGSKPRYTLMRLATNATVDVAEDWQLHARLNGQYTADGLIPGEQFGIGGAASVRGYEERELAGDRGMSAAFELFGPDLASRFGIDGSLRPVIFIDGGHIENRLGTPCLGTRSTCTLTSAGLGTQWMVGNLGGQLFIATALKPAAQTDKNDTRAHVSLSYTF